MIVATNNWITHSWPIEAYEWSSKAVPCRAHFNSSSEQWWQNASLLKNLQLGLQLAHQTELGTSTSINHEPVLSGAVSHTHHQETPPELTKNFDIQSICLARIKLQSISCHPEHNRAIRDAVSFLNCNSQCPSIAGNSLYQHQTTYGPPAVVKLQFPAIPTLISKGKRM